MKIEALFEEWNKDSIIDDINLDTASLDVPKLHAKYLRIFFDDKMRMQKYEADFQVLKREKYVFYTEGHTQETRDKGWELPPRGAIIKSEVQIYLDSDPDIITASLKLSQQKEKVAVLKDIISNINYRHITIKNVMDYRKWSQGSG